MNKYSVGILLIGLASFIVFGFINRGSTVPPQSTTPQSEMKEEQSSVVDKQAAFAIYTNGTFRVFTASMYHNLSEDVFIQADNPNIVHVKRANVTWDDFFKTLPFSLTKECLTTGTKETFCTGQDGNLKFYLNGIRDDSVLEKEIKDGDRILVSYGQESEAQIRKQIERLDATDSSINE